MPEQTAKKPVNVGLKLEDLKFDNIFSQLPEIFYSRHQPEPLVNQFAIHSNARIAEILDIDLDEFRRNDFLKLLTRPESWPGTDSLAMCYAGHQFGQFVPRLGDGRALLLGQIVNSREERWDLQLKGSGLTLYSRQGDGKAVLRSSIREYLCSAALDGLGIPTTHALTLFGSEEEVFREQIETGAMILRVAPSHIRFGTFEYFFYQQRFDDLKMLGEFTLEHYFSHLQDQENPFLALLEEVMQSTASLIAQWQSVGFCHGVMNSDNMSIHGITIDYGPFGFMDTYHAGHICNHSDHGGRYAFDRQPGIGLFNLGCLAQAILPLIDDDPDTAVEMATAVLQKYQGLFDQDLLALKRKKLGLNREEHEDGALYNSLLELMESTKSDFTNTFRNLSHCEGDTSSMQNSLKQDKGFTDWFSRYQARLKLEIGSTEERLSSMKQVNPKFVLRNYMAENAIRAAKQNDFTEIDVLIKLLDNPYLEQPENEKYASNAPDWSNGLALSCSS